MSRDSKLSDSSDPRVNASHEEFTSLLLAARNDRAFRSELLALARMPTFQRQSLVNTALHEMALRGESRSIRAAIALLATDEGARIAIESLSD